MAFNINAQIILDGPKNLRKVRTKIKKELGALNVPIKLQIPKNISSNIKKINTDFQALNNTLSSLATNSTKTAAAMDRIAKTSSKVATASAKSATAAKNQASSINKVGKEAQFAGNAVQKFGKDTALAVRRFAAFSVGTSVIFGFTRAITQGISEAIKFERELIKITQVTGKAGQNLKGLRDTIDQLSTSLGISANELLGVARTFAQTGQSINQIQSSLKAVARASLAPTFDGMADSAEGLIAALNQFDIQANRSEAILGSLNQVSKRFAVEASDLISVIRRAGGVFAASSKQLGAPEERLRELIGIFTAVRSTTRESADTIATGLRTIFSRIQRPKTIDFLKSLGVELRATAEDAKRLGIAQGEFVGVFEALKKVSGIIGTLDTISLAQLVEELGGIRQVGKLIPALRNFEKAERARAEALKGTKSLSNDVALATETLAVKFQKTQARFEKFLRTIAESKTFQNLAKGLLTLANAFITVGEALTPLLPALTALAGLKLTKLAFSGIGGFATSFRAGGGVAATGKTLGGALTGSGSGKLNTAALESAIRANTKSVTNNTTSVSSNTTAIKANTTAITKLSSEIPILTSAIRRISSGAAIAGGVGRGRRRRFARGGFVPGAGNGDTVPAMLEPGEFVIRKSSAKKIGASSLQAMNTQKFARGGRVIANPGQIGVFVLNPPSGNDPDANIPAGVKIPITNPAIISKLGRGPSDKSALQNQVLANASKEDLGQILTGSKKTFKGISSPTLKQIAAPKGRFQPLIQDPKSQKRIDRFVKSPKAKLNPVAVPLGGQISTFFTANRDVKKSPKISKEVKQATKVGMEKAIELATTSTSSVLQGIDPIDASEQKLFKRSLSNLFSKGGGAIETIEGFIFEGLIAGLTGAKIAGRGSTFDFPAFAGVQKERLKNLFGDPGIGTLKKADAKRSFSQGLISTVGKGTIPSKIKDDLNRGITTGVTFANKGGAIGGTRDTVPALLTPGEFVINKSAAKSIGYSNLNTMNKGGVSKFAKGGAVGNVQQFQGGGAVANSAINAFFGLQTLQSIDFSGETSSVSENLINLAFAITFLLDPIKSLGKGLGKLSPAVGSATKSFGAFGNIGKRIAALESRTGATRAGFGIAAGRQGAGELSKLIALIRGGRKGFAQSRRQAGADFFKQTTAANLKSAGLDKNFRNLKTGRFVSNAIAARGQQLGSTQALGPLLSDPALKSQQKSAGRAAFSAKNGKTFGQAIGKQTLKTLGASKGNLLAIGAIIAAGFVEPALRSASGIGEKAGFAGIEERGFRDAGKKTASLGLAGVGGFATGAASGAATGASIGSVIPGVGTAVGAIIGAIVGGIDGAISGIGNELKEQAIFDAFDEINTSSDRLSKTLDTLDEKGINNVIALTNVATAADTLTSTFNRNVQEIVGLRTGSITAGAGSDNAFIQGVSNFDAFKNRELSDLNTFSTGLLFGTGKSGALARNAVDQGSIFRNVGGGGGPTGRFEARRGLAAVTQLRRGTPFGGALSESQIQSVADQGDAFADAIEKTPLFKALSFVGLEQPAEFGAETFRSVSTGLAVENIGRTSATAKAVTQGLSLIPDETFEKAENQFLQLGESVVNSVPTEELAKLAALDSSASFADLADSLGDADQSSRAYKAQLNALTKLQGVRALKNLKALTDANQQRIEQLGEDAPRGSVTAIEGVTTAANAFQSALNSGQTFEDSRTKGEKSFIKSLKDQAKARGRGGAPALEGFSFDSLEQDFANLDAGSESARKKLDALAAAFGLQSANELRARFEDLDGAMQDNSQEIIQQIANQRLLEQAIKDASKGVIALGTALDGLVTGLGNSLGDLDRKTAIFEEDINNILGGPQIAAANVQNVFSGGGAGRSLQEIQGGIGKASAFVGLKPEQTKGFDRAIDLQNQLPEALKKTFDEIGDQASPQDIIDKIKENLGPAFDELPDVVKRQFEANISGIVSGTGFNRQENLGESGVEQLKTAIEEGNLEGLLSETGNKVAETFNGLINAQNKYISVLNRAAQAEIQRDKAATKTRQRVVGLDQEFRFGRSLDPTQARLDRAGATLGSQEIFAGGRVVGGAGRLGTKDLLTDQRFLSQQLKSVQDEKRQGGLTPQAIDSLTQQETKLINALDRNKQAVEQLSNDTSDLQAIQKQIADVEKVKLSAEQRQKLFLQQVGEAKTPEEADKITREFFAPLVNLTKAQQGQKLDPLGALNLINDLEDPAGQARAQLRGQLQGQGFTGQALDDEINKFIDNLRNGLSRGVVDFGAQRIQSAGLAGAPFARTTSERQFGVDQAIGEKAALEAQGQQLLADRQALVQGQFDLVDQAITDQQALYKQELEKTDQEIVKLTARYSELNAEIEKNVVASEKSNLESRKSAALGSIREAKKGLPTARKADESQLQTLFEGDSLLEGGQDLGIGETFRSLTDDQKSILTAVFGEAQAGGRLGSNVSNLNARDIEQLEKAGISKTDIRQFSEAASTSDRDFSSAARVSDRIDASDKELRTTNAALEANAATLKQIETNTKPLVEEQGPNSFAVYDKTADKKLGEIAGTGNALSKTPQTPAQQAFAAAAGGLGAAGTGNALSKTPPTLTSKTGRTKEEVRKAIQRAKSKGRKVGANLLSDAKQFGILDEQGNLKAEPKTEQAFVKPSLGDDGLGVTGRSKEDVQKQINRLKAKGQPIKGNLLKDAQAFGILGAGGQEDLGEGFDKQGNAIKPLTPEQTERLKAVIPKADSEFDRRRAEGQSVSSIVQEDTRKLVDVSRSTRDTQPTPATTRQAQRKAGPTAQQQPFTLPQDLDLTVFQGFADSVNTFGTHVTTFSASVDKFAATAQEGINVNINGDQKPIEVILNGGGLQNILNQQTLDQIANAVSEKLRSGGDTGNGPRPDGSTADPTINNLA